MTMAWNIEKLRETGNSADATLADMLQLRLEARGDFDFPAEKAVETIDTPEIQEQTTDQELLPSSSVSSEIARVAFGDITEHEVSVMSLEAIENNVALKEAFNAILAPYVAGANAKVQHAETLTGWKRVGEHTWRDTQILNGHVTNVFFKTPYQSLGAHNEALGLEVAYTRHDKPHKRDLHISMSFKDGGVNTLTLKREESSPSGFGYSAPDILCDLLNTLPENKRHTPDRYSIDEAWDQGLLKGYGENRDQSHTFYLQRNIVEIITKDHDGYSTIARKFDPEKNVFHSQRQTRHEKLPTISENTIEPELMLSFVEGLLATLPRQNTA